jgi:hypothetical protein
MTERERWVRVATYAAVIEAEFAAEMLKAAGIPAQVDAGEAVGIFGGGFQGRTNRGVHVRVPASFAADARDRLHTEAGTA